MPGLETVLVPARHDGPLGRARRVLTLAALLALLGWQTVAALRDATGELTRHGLADRLDALRLDAPARRRANLGDDEALHRALVEHVDAADPQLVLWFPAARPGRLLEPQMALLADHLRALLFPMPVRSYSAARPVPEHVEAALDETYYVVDLTGGAPLPFGDRFERVTSGEAWALLRFRGAAR